MHGKRELVCRFTGKQDESLSSVGSEVLAKRRPIIDL
jgi:hypothetical protein